MTGLGVGAGVDAREDVALDPLPLTPFDAGDFCAGDRLAPQEAMGRGAGDFPLPREGKSPSERRLGGVLGFRGRLGVEESGLASASIWRCWAGESVSEPLTGAEGLLAAPGKEDAMV